jgi:hypothetical protein
VKTRRKTNFKDNLHSVHVPIDIDQANDTNYEHSVCLLVRTKEIIVHTVSVRHDHTKYHCLCCHVSFSSIDFVHVRLAGLTGPFKCLLSKPTDIQ